MIETLDQQILRWRAVAALTGLSRPTLWRLTREGRFPKPVQLSSANAVGWIRSEVQSWIDSRIADRDHQLPRTAPESPGRPRREARQP